MNVSEIKAPLFFIRHGETDWNNEKRFQGQADIPLNECGRAQAVKNAKLLSRKLEQYDLDFNKVSFVTSPLLRATETASLLLETMGLRKDQLSRCVLLKEISFGLWEGLTPAEAKQQYYHQRQKRRLDRWSIAPPGGESFASRVRDIENLLNSLSAPSVVVSHSGIMRIIFHLLQNTPPLEAVKADIPHIGVQIWDGKSLIPERI